MKIEQCGPTSINIFSCYYASVCYEQTYYYALFTSFLARKRVFPAGREN